MAQRRMFSNRITDSAKFLKMPLSSQALYFHLGLHADDDGVVEAFSVMRQTGAVEDDLRILVAKNSPLCHLLILPYLLVGIPPTRCISHCCIYLSSQFVLVFLYLVLCHLPGRGI
ncbi:hypothetical protein WP50_00105 [Lactiplantibacillus plantarum]|nr:hypothetical protein WP50_00105 [Lactiplantibacillus plantarum]